MAGAGAVLRPPKNERDPAVVGWWRAQWLALTAAPVVVLAVLGVLIAPARPWLLTMAAALAVLGTLSTALLPSWRYLPAEVAARVLGESAVPTGAALVAHPRAARVRRLRWALLAVLVAVAVLPPVLPYVAAGCAAAGVPLAVAPALDAYRNLGHGVDGAYPVARSGTVRRATTALRRGGVIGWTVKQSVFQRRAGLLTLTATTAAGAGSHPVRDAAGAEGLAFAAQAVPGLLEPFLIREPGPGGSADAR